MFDHKKCKEFVGVVGQTIPKNSQPQPQRTMYATVYLFLFTISYMYFKILITVFAENLAVKVNSL